MSDEQYTLVDRADKARVQAVLSIIRGRFDEAVMSVDGFTRTEAIMVAVTFLREVVNTSCLELADNDVLGRAQMYDAAIVTSKRLLEDDLARPIYRGPDAG